MYKVHYNNVCMCVRERKESIISKHREREREGGLRDVTSLLCSLSSSVRMRSSISATGRAESVAPRNTPD